MENGESAEAYSGAYSEMLGNLQMYMGAMAEHYGLIKSKSVVQTPAATDANAIDPSILMQGARPMETIR
jgi:hypothetical protein